MRHCKKKCVKAVCKPPIDRETNTSRQEPGFMAEHGPVILAVIMLGILAMGLIFAMDGVGFAIPVRVV